LRKQTAGIQNRLQSDGGNSHRRPCHFSDRYGFAGA
jgi:hypothetical protein